MIFWSGINPEILELVGTCKAGLDFKREWATCFTKLKVKWYNTVLQNPDKQKNSSIPYSAMFHILLAVYDIRTVYFQLLDWQNWKLWDVICLSL